MNKKIPDCHFMYFPVISPWCLILLHPPLNIVPTVSVTTIFMGLLRIPSAFTVQGEKRYFGYSALAKPRFRSWLHTTTKDGSTVVVAENLLCKQK